jgi:hypothetical protein
MSFQSVVLYSVVLAATIFANGAQADLAAREAEVFNVPSGQPVSFHDSIVDRPATGLTARFRFIAPQLATHLQTNGYAAVEVDLAYLCETYAVKRIAAPLPALIVVSMSEVPVEFGSYDPDVTQVFEGYRPEGDTCAWEAF